MQACYFTQTWMAYLPETNLGVTDSLSTIELCLYSWNNTLHKDMSKRNHSCWNFSGNQHHSKWTKEVCVLSAVSQFLFLLCAASGKAIASALSATLTQTEQPLYNVSSFLKIFQNTTAAKIESLQEPIIVNILEESSLERWNCHCRAKKVEECKSFCIVVPPL